jgi:histone-lysine N-methyltransferase SETMAR
VHIEFVPEEKTVNAQFYKGNMDGLLKRIKRVRPAAFYSRDFFLLHVNAPAHKAARFCEFLNQKNVKTLYHATYSPDVSPPDYFLFPKLKKIVKRAPFCGCC